MPHPFTWSESLLVATRVPVTAPEVLDRMERMLKRESPLQLERTETGVTFRTGFSRMVTGWSPLAGITSGTVEVRARPEAVDIRYTLGFGQIAAIATVMIAIGAFQLYVLADGPPMPPTMLLTGWAMLVGGSMGVALMRFPRFLRTAVQAAVSGPVPSRGGAQSVTPAGPAAPRR